MNRSVSLLVFACAALSAAALQPATPNSAAAPALAGRVKLRVRPLDANVTTSFSELRAKAALAAQPALTRMVGAWSTAPAILGPRTIIDIDLRTGGPLSVEPDGLPWIPGTGVNNKLSRDDMARYGAGLAADPNDPSDASGVNQAVLERIAREFMNAHPEWFPVPQNQLVASAIIPDTGHFVRHVLFTQLVNGVPVEDAELIFNIGHGNLLSFGGQFLGPVTAPTTPGLTPQDARQSALLHAGLSEKEVSWLQKTTLRLVIIDNGAAVAGGGYAHRLVYQSTFLARGMTGTWRAEVDALTGEIVSFKDINDYASGTIIGGVQPLSNDGSCPTGCEQPGYPMPFADAGGGVFTDTGGNYAGAGTGTTALNGKYVKSLNTGFCSGAINETAAAGVTNLGVSGGTDCTIPAGRSAGDTHSARDAFYNVNKLKEEVRGWLPAWAFNNNQVTVNVNLNQTCNAYWNGTSLNMFKSSASCRNTGEIAMIFDHELGHGYDANDGGGASNPGEAYADNTASIHHHDSCIGRGFFTGTGKCGGYGDACTVCTGVRGSDWTAHVSNKPHTILDLQGPGTTPMVCPAGSDICGFETHCAAYPIIESVWDAATIDLAHNAIPTNGGAACAGTSPGNPVTASQAWTLLSKIWWKGVGTLGSQYACATNGTAGCGVPTTFHNMKVQDDDNGNLADGTPHAAELECAFNRHQTGCTTDNNVDFTTCPALLAPTVTTTPGNNQVILNWTAVTNATQYRVFRNEDSCGAGYSLIATLASGTLTYTDTGLLNGRTYYYQVQPVGGASNQCDGQPSACVTGVPVSGPVCAAPTGMANNTAADVAACASSGITVTWTAPTTWGDAVTTSRSYTVLRDGVAIAAGPCSGALPTTTLSCVDTPGNALAHTYTVRANNSCGLSFTTAGASATDVNNSAGAPTAVSATTANCANITTTYTNGAGAASHNILRYTGACPSVAGLTTFTGTTSPYVDATATAGSSYCIVVRAVNACGTTDAAGVTGTRAAAAVVPGAPTATATCAGINLTWTAVAGATTYNVLRNAVQIATGIAVTNYSDPTAVAGTAYVYTLQTVNSCSTSAAGAGSASTTRPATPAPTITGPAASCSPDALSTQVFTTYQWQLGGVNIGGATAQNYGATASGNYTVVTTNAAGCTGTSPAVAVTINPPPSAPTAVSATTANCANITTTWTNGAGATSHNLLRYNGACPSVAGLTTFSTVTTPYVDATAASGSSYCIVAQAQNACGTTNAAGVTGTRAAPATTPGAPTATGTCAGVNLTWTAVAGASTYNVLRNAVQIATGIAVTNYSDATAVAGTPYTYTLQAVNGCSTSAAGPASAATARLLPPSPTVTGPTTGCGSIPLSTQAYTAYQWNLGGVPVGGAIAQNYSALATGTYSVTATGANGCSATSPGLAVTVTPGSQTFHFQVQNTFVAAYKDMQNATGFEAAVQQQSTATITATGEYQIGSTPLRWLSPAYAKNTDLASSPWTFDVYGLTTNTGAAGLLYAKVYSYNAGTPVLIFTTGYAATDISTAGAQTRFTWNYTPAAGTTLATGDRLVAEIWVHATAGSTGTPSNVNDLVTAETNPPTLGSITVGTFTNTQVCDGTREEIRETAATPATLNHVWTIPLTAGTAHTFTAVAWTNSATDQDVLQWGTTPTGPWTTMFNVTQSASPGCAAPQTFALSGALTGNLYIRAFPGATNATRTRVNVDYMAVVTTVPGPDPFFSLSYDFGTADTLITAADCAGVVAVKPPETSGTVAAALTASKGATIDTVVLNFEDVTVAGVTGYNAYEGNMPFAAATPYTHGSAPGNVCNVTTTVAAGRRTTPAAGIGTAGSHYYLITAFNTTLEGPSGYDSAAVEIPPAMSTCAP